MMEPTSRFRNAGQPTIGSASSQAGMTGGFNADSAQQLYNQYQGAQPGADRDNLVKMMQGGDNGAAFNQAMRSGGNMLSGGANGQYSYSGGHQGAPGSAAGTMNPYGNKNPYMPGGVTDQVNAMQAAQAAQGAGGGGMKGAQGGVRGDQTQRPGFVGGPFSNLTAHGIQSPMGQMNRGTGGLSPNQRMAATYSRGGPGMNPFNSPFSGPRGPGGDYSRLPRNDGGMGTFGPESLQINPADRWGNHPDNPNGWNS